MNKHNQIKKLVILGLLTAIMIIMAVTPLGYIPIGPLAITTYTIPVAIAAICLGPVGGTIIGAIFGITSYAQCFGFGVGSPLGAELLAINPFLTAIVCIVPRILVGLLVGFAFKGFNKLTGPVPAYFITGFLTAFLNTVFFMSLLVLLFGQTEYLQELINGQNILVWICAFVGINAIVEMVASPIVTGAVCIALKGAKQIPIINEEGK